jgi:polyisoprenoid-binding protein YceI
MSRRGRLALCLAAALSLAAAQAGRPMTQVWSIEAARSQAQFWSHPRLLPRSGGQFQSVAGEMIGSPQGGWRVLVRVDARSLKFAGPRWMERLTRSDAFLAVERYPDIRFESASFTDALLHSGGALEGQLTLRGQTRAVRFELQPSRCEEGAGSCVFQVNGQVNRHNFGMSAYRLTLRDEVDIEFRVHLQPGVAP